MYEVTITIEFDYAHRLMKNDGSAFYDKSSCGSNHGHRGVAEIVFQSEKLDEYGFVIDFKDAKKFCKDWIDKHFDHATLLHPEDTEFIEFLQKRGDKVFIMPILTPSAENIAYTLYNAITKVYGRKIVKEVSIYETPTSKATYRENN